MTRPTSRPTIVSRVKATKKNDYKIKSENETADKKSSVAGKR